MPVSSPRSPNSSTTVRQRQYSHGHVRRIGGSDGLVFSAAPSRCAHTARTVGAADRTAEPELRNKGISHASIACMRVTLESARSEPKIHP
jgi:hypothetical protein